MGKPHPQKGTRNAISEMMSASSSLHMPPDPIPKEKQWSEAMFLDEMDYSAQHSMAHIREAIQSLRFDKWQKRRVFRYLKYLMAVGASDKTEEHKRVMLRIVEDRIWKVIQDGVFQEPWEEGM